MPLSSVPLPAPAPRRTLLRAAVAGGLTALTAGAAHAAGRSAPAAPAARAAAPPPLARLPETWILACDQATQSVLLLDATSAYWRSGGADDSARAADLQSLWSWTPVDDATLDDLDPVRTWRNVSEAKARPTAHGPLLLTCASGGLVAAVRREGEAVYWATALPAVSNPHSVELLPDGNIAVAASTGGFVRLYAASRGERATAYTSFELPGAHGLLWDAGDGLLWALGSALLVGLAVEGSPANPGLRAVRTVALPDSGGHDLARAVGPGAPLWVSTSAHVRLFAPGSGTFTAFGDADGVDRPSVKSVSQHPVSGQILTVSPEPGAPCTWCTSRIRFHGPGGEEELRGSSLYKARWWSADAS
ncbi:DUF6528 family protein [Streptomyces sp. NPDC059070]|uniref:DUF6528 family protein n=1 Tax=Streptomyces sp. NPDC059070 TaxID=3346713 RepID=UPI00367955AA